MALDSNGLRVLCRVGFAEEQKNYSATYGLVQDAIREQLPRDYDSLIRAHQLLRQHGQELCKRSKPLCIECPVLHSCVPWSEELIIVLRRLATMTCQRMAVGTPFVGNGFRGTEIAIWQDSGAYVATTFRAHLLLDGSDLIGQIDPAARFCRRMRTQSEN